MIPRKLGGVGVGCLCEGGGSFGGARDETERVSVSSDEDGRRRGSFIVAITPRRSLRVVPRRSGDVEADVSARGYTAGSPLGTRTVVKTSPRGPWTGTSTPRLVFACQSRAAVSSNFV
jgi:hypothetical protein